MAAALSADGILAELHKLWASLADQSASQEHQAVLRACAMTLIVVAEETEDTVSTSQAIAQVMRDHPNRAVIVRVRAGAGTFLGQQVTAQCWMPFGTRQQICCEQVEITASDASLTGLMPILLAIIAPDLPVVVWCRGPRVFGLPEMAPLFARAGKLIVDSAAFSGASAALDALRDQTARGRRVADLSWTRVTRWREMVAEIFEDPARRDLTGSIRQVKVLYAGETPPATAYYLAGWVAACTGRGDLDVQFESVPPVGGGIEALVLAAESHAISIRRAEGDTVLIEADSFRNCAVMPRLTEAELLGNELAIAGRDPVFEKSLPAAARLAHR